MIKWHMQMCYTGDVDYKDKKGKHKEKQQNLRPQTFGINYEYSTNKARSTICILLHPSIISKNILYVTCLVNMSHFTTSTSIIDLYTYFCSLNLNEIALARCYTNLSFVYEQTTSNNSPSYFLNGNHPYL